jgi:hypothetical protein
MSPLERSLITVEESTHRRIFLPELETKQARAAATAAGAGSGTLVALIANNLPDSNGAKPWLILIAPSVSLASGAVWMWAQAKFANFVKEYELKLLIAQANKAINEAMKHPNMPEKEVLRLNRMRDELVQMKLERVMQQVRIKNNETTL